MLIDSGTNFQAILEHPDVVEAAVVGKADKLKGHVPLGIVVLKTGLCRVNSLWPSDVMWHHRKCSEIWQAT